MAVNAGKKEKTWTRILRENRMNPAEICRLSGLAKEELAQIDDLFPIRINGNLNTGSEAVMKQFLPSLSELNDTGEDDPLAEVEHERAPGIIHRYPNRVLFLVSNICASYCRFCTRRRLVGKQASLNDRKLGAGIQYIADHEEIDEVILSGGDPLMLSDKKLETILIALRKIPHIGPIRVSTRALVVLPERITVALVKMLQQFNPLYLITQINHPDELTAKTDAAIACLVDHGIPVLNQSVLLKGINDQRRIMLKLVKNLIERRVRPYYLHQMDPARGTLHFRVPVKKGKEIIASLRENIGGYAVPHYVFDDPRQNAKTLLFP